VSNLDNRVLCRLNARDLTAEEMDNIGGGIGTVPTRDVTTTFCTILPHKDGDDD
jgi:hypothetical protein